VQAAMRWHRGVSVFSPFEIVFGQRPNLLIYLELRTPDWNVFTLRAKHERTVHEIVKEALAKRALENKTQYDKKVKERSNKVRAGDLVMVKTLRSKSSLDLQMLGPFRVVMWTSPTNLKLEAMDKTKISIHPVVHINRCRKTTVWRNNLPVREEEKPYITAESVRPFRGALMAPVIPFVPIPAPILAPIPAPILAPIPFQSFMDKCQWLTL